MNMVPLEITQFTPQDESEARALILKGLEEHWGVLDPSMNPDLDDLGNTYAGEIFLLARSSGRIIGTGAIIREDEYTGRVVRMSVASEMRRGGVGSRLLEALCAQAQARGYRRLVLETTTTWRDAIGFYQHFGFEVTGTSGGDIHFVLCF